MKRILAYFLIITIVLSALIPAMPVMASNTTLAKYVGTIRITNNCTTSATHVAPTFNLTTQDLIDGNFCWSNCTNTCMQTNASADTAYMPAPGTGEVWCVYVPSILAKSTLDYKLYLGGGQSMDSELLYFSSPTNNMTTIDDATLELGNNGTVELGHCFINASVADDIMSKDSAFTFSSDGAGTVTASIMGGETDVDQDLTTNTWPLYSTSYNYLGQRLDGFVGAITEVRFWLDKVGNPTGTGYIRVLNVADDSIIGTIDSFVPGDIGGVATEYTFNANSVVVASATNIRIVVDATGVAGDGANKFEAFTRSADLVTGIATYATAGPAWTDNAAWDARFGFKYSSIASVSAAGLTTGEYTFNVASNTTHLSLSVDGTEEDITALAFSMTDNSNDWYTSLNGIITYLGYQEICVNGTQRQYVEWENDETTFTDLSGNGNDALPAFRTGTSDACVTAELISFDPYSTATAGDWSIDDPDDMITAEGTPEGFYDETLNTTVPGVPVIVDVMPAGVSTNMFIVPLIMVVMCIIILLVGKYSLLASVIIATLALFAANPLGIPPWIPIIFFLDGLAMVFASKQFNW